MSTALHPASTAGTRTVTTRRVGFDHDDVGADRHFVDHDLLSSHILAVLSAIIPPGERFFADTGRRFRSELEGPLRDQVNGFIGQERVHQREHQRFNETLARLGYPTAIIDRASALTFAVADRFPARLQISMTAAIEHWTAVIAEAALASDQLGGWETSAETSSFLAWHMVEELEHRAVAFDIMQGAGVGEVERIAAMRVATALLAPAVVGGLLLSLALDRDTWNPFRVRRSLRHLRRSAFVRPSVLRDLLRYNRRGFHPDERDVDDLLAEWRSKLFGADGLVTVVGPAHAS